jgi:enoyl-CoA hydratase
MNYQNLLVDVAPVSTVTVNRPKVLNALDDTTLRELTDAFIALSADPAVRCVIVTGAGDKAFVAGADIAAMTEMGAVEAQAFAERGHRLSAVMEGARAPIIAAVNGFALGGGLELALACDIRVAARGIKLGMPPAKLGLIYSHTGLRRFIDACGVANTAELFYVGRNVDADRAERMGLVNEIVDPAELDEHVLDLAAEIAANAPLSLAGNKHVIRTLRAQPLPEEVERELIELRESCFRSEDFREGVRAFAEKRKPRWQGR